MRHEMLDQGDERYIRGGDANPETPITPVTRVAYNPLDWVDEVRREEFDNPNLVRGVPGSPSNPIPVPKLPLSRSYPALANTGKVPALTASGGADGFNLIGALALAGVLYLISKI